MSSGVYIYIYIFVMVFATWLMRVAASLVMKKPIENRFFIIMIMSGFKHPVAFIS